MTIEKNSWGVTRDSVLNDYYTIQQLIKELASTVRLVRQTRSQSSIMHLFSQLTNRTKRLMGRIFP